MIITAAAVPLAFLRVDVAHITQFNPMLHVCTNSAHTFLQQSRTCSFSWNQIEAPYIPVPLTSAKQKCKTFPSCLIFINSSSIIITDEQLGSLTAAHSRQPLLVWFGQFGQDSYGMWMCVSRTLFGRRATLLCFIYNYQMNLLLWMLYFCWTMILFVVGKNKTKIFITPY